MIAWPAEQQAIPGFDLAFDGHRGYFRHDFRAGSLTVTASELEYSSTSEAIGVTLTDEVSLFRFSKPGPGADLRVDLIVDRRSGSALAVHHVSRPPRTGSEPVIERGSLGRVLLLDALLDFPGWESASGTFVLHEGESGQIIRIGVSARGRLTAPHAGRVLEIRPDLLVVPSRSSRDSQTVVIHLGMGRYFASGEQVAVGEASFVPPTITF